MRGQLSACTYSLPMSAVTALPLQGSSWLVISSPADFGRSSDRSVMHCGTCTVIPFCLETGRFEVRCAYNKDMTRKVAVCSPIRVGSVP